MFLTGAIKTSDSRYSQTTDFLQYSINGLRQSFSSETGNKG
jgi:hypothetical protein